MSVGTGRSVDPVMARCEFPRMKTLGKGRESPPISEAIVSSRCADQEQTAYRGYSFCLPMRVLGRQKLVRAIGPMRDKTAKRCHPDP